ncbi:DNA-directed RNA polymerase I subunit RPA34.5-domain-containing protein [Geopyxis carbonaria]|nr:DNA-directed RNA polymerase I subunit RPA34.5-domain-containing protein [Geopyxis carbonaria]
MRLRAAAKTFTSATPLQHNHHTSTMGETANTTHKRVVMSPTATKDKSKKDKKDKAEKKEKKADKKAEKAKKAEEKGEKENTEKRKTETVRAPQSPPTKRKAPKAVPKSQETVDASDLDDDEDMDDASSSDSSDDDDDSPRSGPNTTITNAVTLSASAAYKTPDTFHPPSRDSLLPPSTNPFSAKNLAGKELWLFTAPAAMPLHKLPSLIPASLVSGAPVVETKAGRGFCLKEDQEAVGMVDLLTPDGDGLYRVSKVPISRSFRGAETAPPFLGVPEGYVARPKPVRLQPEGLKMRFTAMGAVPVDNTDAAGVDYMDIDDAAPAGDDEGRKKKRHKTDGEKKERKEKKEKKEKKSKAAK